MCGGVSSFFLRTAPITNSLVIGRENIAQTRTIPSRNDMSLQARAKRQRNRRQVSLKGDPTDGGNVNICRDGNIVQTTADDGTPKDNLGITTGPYAMNVLAFGASTFGFFSLLFDCYCRFTYLQA